MDEQVYQHLAETLNRIPNGFPPAESGIHLRVLAKMFEPQEAALAAEMRLDYETASVIAERAGVDHLEARRTLKEMVRRGLIYVGRQDGKLVFALMPFVVGFYEEQLPRIDREMAELVEAYFDELRGTVILDVYPPIHRVVPVKETVPFDLELFPYQDAVSIVENAKSWGVRECICRIQQKLLDKGCDRPLEACLVMAPIEGVFGGDGHTKSITKEEALEILRVTEEAGLVHSTGNFQDDHHYI